MIDPRSVIDPAARIAENVRIGPYAVIGADVEIGSGSRVGPHVVINGPARIGADNTIYQFASIGDTPQDKKYSNEPTLLVIGNRNVIREYVTINRGTVQDEGITRVGDDNWIMAYAHIAHDCRVGNHTVFANGATLGGHVRVDDYATLGGFTLVHQRCLIGSYAFSAYGSGIHKDIPPYVLVSGSPAHPHGLNKEGLRRHGFSNKAQQDLQKAYRYIYREGLPLGKAIVKLRELSAECREVDILLDFLQQQTRGIIR